MRKVLCSLILILSSTAHADSVLLLYETSTSRNDIESTLRSFGFDVMEYWESIHGGHVTVPCGEAELWVTVLSQVKGISNAGHNYAVSIGGNSPMSIPTCAPESEAMYDDELERLIIPRLHLDGMIYRAELMPPFNIQGLEFVGELTVYPFGK